MIIIISSEKKYEYAQQPAIEKIILESALAGN
jgi:hypothetical protein